MNNRDRRYWEKRDKEAENEVMAGLEIPHYYKEEKVKRICKNCKFYADDSEWCDYHGKEKTKNSKCDAFEEKDKGDFYIDNLYNGNDE